MSKARELANLGNAYSDGALSNRNLIINGAMQVAQRGTSFTTGSSNMYTLDRWRSQGTYDTESLTIEQSTDAPDGFGNSLKITVSTAESTGDAQDYHMVTQKFEGQNLTQLNYGSSSASTMTFSFWVKASIAQTYCVSLYQTNGNKHYSQTYTVNAANTWEYKTVSISGNTANAIAFDNSGELEVGFMLGAGTYYSSGSNDFWGGAAHFAAGANHTFMTTANATLQITGVQLEVGDTATPFEHRSYGDELARCQRYFQRFGGGATTGRMGLGAWNNSTSADICVHLTHEMRAIPSVTAVQGGRILDFAVAWHDVTSLAGAVESTRKLVNLNVNNTSQPSAANQGDAAALGGGGAPFDYWIDAEL